HIVSLHRRNLLRRHLSFHVRPKRAVPKSPLTPLTLDSDQLVADFEHQTATIAAFDRRFHDHPLIKVTYEDLCTNYEATMRDLQRFLNVPYRRLKPETPKLSSRTLPEAIQNYHELKEQFAGTQWAGFFDD
ncbi:MAG TPA: hypothetical protein VJ719_02180, partial [Chthoniobacterales bacterium]|nr:hypothetical protein [Chthoniobacterales bacterium]